MIMFERTHTGFRSPTASRRSPIVNCREGSQKELQLIAERAARGLPLGSAQLCDECHYASVPLCIIDALFSPGARYASTRNVVARYCEYFELRRLHFRRGQIPPVQQQESVSDFCRNIEPLGVERFTDEVFRNHQRSSPINGILKAEPAYRFALTLRDFEIEYFQDVIVAGRNPYLKRAIYSIPGPQSGFSLHYFWMLAGVGDYIKPDRIIIRFLQSALDRTVSARETHSLIAGASSMLATRFPHLTPKLLDYEILKFQRQRFALDGRCADT